MAKETTQYLLSMSLATYYISTVKLPEEGGRRGPHKSQHMTKTGEHKKATQVSCRPRPLFWTITFSMNPYGLSRQPETNVQAG